MPDYIYKKDNTKVQSRLLDTKSLSDALSKYKRIKKMQSDPKFMTMNFKELSDMVSNTENKSAIPQLKTDTRSNTQRDIATKYYEDVTNPSIKQQATEAVQLPLRYLANPLKITGDLAQTIIPNSALAKDLPSTLQDRYDYRKKQLKPKQNMKEILTQSFEESTPLTKDALLNLGAPESTIGKIGQSTKNLYKEYRTLRSISKQTPLEAAKISYYRNAPWTWKPSPDSYYRAGPKEMIDDAIESGIIRIKHRESLADIAIREGRVPTIYEKLDAGSRAKGEVYFSKGAPLSSTYNDRYGSKTTSNFGNYIIETNSKNMKEIGPKGRALKEEVIGDNIKIGRNATPVVPLNVQETKVLTPHWFYGYKDYKSKIK